MTIDRQPLIDLEGTFRAPASWASRTEFHDPSNGDVGVMHTVSFRQEQTVPARVERAHVEAVPFADRRKPSSDVRRC